MTKRVCIRCGTRYPANSECPKHPREQRPAWRTTHGTRQSRGYDNQWLQLRAIVLAEEPHCRRCGKPSTTADHIKPLAHGGSRLARTNIQALCTSCHRTKTGRDAHHV